MAAPGNKHSGQHIPKERTREFLNSMRILEPGVITYDGGFTRWQAARMIEHIITLLDVKDPTITPLYKERSGKDEQ